jgi:ABC-2 type transport system permease protein
VKFREIFRFEFVYQARGVRTWLYFAVLFVVAYLIIRENSIDDARNGHAFVNSPYVITATTVISSLLWVLVATPVAGSAAARDVQTRMHPLVYTTPVSKTDYLGGRFLAALALNALILLAVPAGILLALVLPGIDPEILGPFRPAAYLSAYVVVALPSAFAVTAIQFSSAAMNRRATASYLGSVLFFVTVSIGAGAVIHLLHLPTLGKLLDPIGYITVVGVLSKTWTPIEKNTILIGLESSMLANRILWIGIGLGVLAFTHRRFRFGERAARTKSRRATRRDAPYAR